MVPTAITISIRYRGFVDASVNAVSGWCSDVGEIVGIVVGCAVGVAVGVVVGLRVGVEVGWVETVGEG